MLQEARTKVHFVIPETADKKLRDSVSCVNCTWQGRVHDTDLIKCGPRKLTKTHSYICCPRCGGELTDLTSNQRRRWIR